VRGAERVARGLLSRSGSLADDWLESRLIRRRVIREVQAHLRDLGHYAGPLDGIPGSKTEDALVAFQRHADIRVDAMIGPEVIRHLEAAVIALGGPGG
jgi:peptidoglycan hydrolase-like protein with peptidoglycan-binding domain